MIYLDIFEDFIKQGKNINNIESFDESLSASELKTIDVNDISISISDWWISIDDALPKEKTPVLVYTTDGHIEKASIYFGISKEQRLKLKDSDPIRCRTFKFADEEGNNKKPYSWSSGAVDYFGQQVLYWMPLPAKPELNNKII